MGQKMDRIQVDYSKVCIIGDLNFDLLDPSKSNTLTDFITQYDLHQLVEGPRNTTVHGLTQIDIILT